MFDGQVTSLPSSSPAAPRRIFLGHPLLFHIFEFFKKNPIESLFSREILMERESRVLFGSWEPNELNIVWLRRTE